MLTLQFLFSFSFLNTGGANNFAVSLHSKAQSDNRLMPFDEKFRVQPYIVHNIHVLLEHGRGIDGERCAGLEARKRLDEVVVEVGKKKNP